MSSPYCISWHYVNNKIKDKIYSTQVTTTDKQLFFWFTSTRRRRSEGDKENRSLIHSFIITESFVATVLKAS